MTGKSRKFSTKDVVYPALMCALLIAGQYVFSFVSGVEIVTVLLLCFSVAFGVKRGVLCAVAFSLLRCLVFGFFPNVVLLYLIYYPTFAAAFGLLGKLKKDLFSHCPVWLAVLVNVLLVGIAASCACTACLNLIPVSRLLLETVRVFLWVIFALCAGLCLAFDSLLVAGKLTQKDFGTPLRVIVFAGFAAAFTVCFTLLDDVITPFFYAYAGEAALAYFYASFTAMLPQVVCAAVTVFILFLPLTGALERVKG